MIKAIPMEDWLRGCIYHDGRSGYVTLPTDKVLEIANYIQRTRRSGADGLIDLEVVKVDRKTEPSDSEKPNNCETCANGEGDIEACGYCRHGDLYEPKTEPQTLTAEEKAELLDAIGGGEFFPKDEPQTDGYMTAEQTKDYRKMLDKAVYDKWGNVFDARADIEEELQKCYLRKSCDHYGDKQVCGRCRHYNLYSHTKTEPKTELVNDSPIIACPIQEEDADYARWLYEDEPQTDLLVKTPRKSRDSHEKNCETCRDKDTYDEWQGNCDECENGSMYSPQTDCDRYAIVNDEGERAYNCIGCEQTDCAWKKGE